GSHVGRFPADPTRWSEATTRMCLIQAVELVPPQNSGVGGKNQWASIRPSANPEREVLGALQAPLRLLLVLRTCEAATPRRVAAGLRDAASIKHAVVGPVRAAAPARDARAVRRFDGPARIAGALGRRARSAAEESAARLHDPGEHLGVAGHEVVHGDR